MSSAINKMTLGWGGLCDDLVDVSLPKSALPQATKANTKPNTVTVWILLIALPLSTFHAEVADRRRRRLRKQPMRAKY